MKLTRNSYIESIKIREFRVDLKRISQPMLRDLMRFCQFIFLFFILATLGHAQGTYLEWMNADRGHTGLEVIERDWQTGRLSRAAAVEQQLRLIVAPHTVMTEYSGLVSEEAFKCLTPLLWEAEGLKINTASIFQAGSLADETQNDEFKLLSKSKMFEVTYYLEGEHAISPADADSNNIPDYAELTAFYADSSYRHMVNTLGFESTFPSKNMPIRINIRKLATGLYGYVSSFDLANSAIYIQSDYNKPQFIRNDDANKPLGAMKVTVAHELKHVMQSVVIKSFNNPFSWIEMDATLMEEVVFDNVNDYYTYLRSNLSVFFNPSKTVVPGSYYHSSWALYFVERFGISYWKNVWEHFVTQRPNPHMITAMNAVASQFKTTLEEELTRNMLWHYASGDNYRAGYGFSEGMKYPDIKVDTSITDLSRNVQIPVIATPNFAGRLYVIDFGAYTFSTTDTLQFSFKNDSPNQQFTAGFLAYYKDGTVQELIPKRTNDSQLVLRPNFNFSNMEKMIITMVNTAGFVSSGVIKLSSSMAVGLDEERPEIADRTELLPNYPNPFNPTTTIPFRLASSGKVKLEVLDLLGRRVALLADTYYTSGRHQIVFDAGKLSSGVYFTRLSTPEGTFTQKMSLVK